MSPKKQRSLGKPTYILIIQEEVKSIKLFERFSIFSNPYKYQKESLSQRWWMETNAENQEVILYFHVGLTQRHINQWWNICSTWLNTNVKVDNVKNKRRLQGSKHSSVSTHAYQNEYLLNQSFLIQNLWLFVEHFTNASFDL